MQLGNLLTYFENSNTNLYDFVRAILSSKFVAIRPEMKDFEKSSQLRYIKAQHFPE